jgi:hypothetical protein
MVDGGGRYQGRLDFDVEVRGSGIGGTRWAARADAAKIETP